MLETRPKKLHQTSHVVAIDTGEFFSVQDPPNFVKMAGEAGCACDTSYKARTLQARETGLRLGFLKGFGNIDIAY